MFEILLVADNEATAQALSATLRRAGHRVTASTTIAGTVETLMRRGQFVDVIMMSTQFGSSLTRLRLTYVGGYFFETLEPTDGGYPTSTPSGSTALPNDLLLAWLTQINAWFLKRDKLNLIAAAGANPEAAGIIAQLGQRSLEPEVKLMLQTFVRYV